MTPTLTRQRTVLHESPTLTRLVWEWVVRSPDGHCVYTLDERRALRLHAELVREASR